MSLKIDSRFYKTLSARLTISTLVLFAVTLTMVFLTYYIFLSTNIKKSIIKDLEDNITEFTMLYKNKGIYALKNEFNNEILSDGSSSFFYQFLSPKREIIFSTDTTSWRRLNGKYKKLNTNEPLYITSVHIPNHKYPIWVAEAKLFDNNYMRIGGTFEDYGKLKERFRETIGYVLFFMIPIVALFSYLLGHKATNGINRLSKAAASVDNQSLHLRIPVMNDGLEIEDLTKSFNSMLDRIESLINEQREITDNIAHDLRSPVTAIRGLAETTLTGNVNPENYQNALSDIIEVCDRLISIINTMLEISQSETGILKIEQKSVDICKLIRDGLALFTPLAEEKNIELVFEENGDNIFITGDYSKLQRVISNLIDNAIKYTDNGKIIFSIKKENELVRISITDTGIGIPAEAINKVFDRFYQVDKSRGNFGNGLGLSFVKSIVELHGGAVSIKSKDGLGTTVILDFPKC